MICHTSYKKALFNGKIGIVTQYIKENTDLIQQNEYIKKKDIFNVISGNQLILLKYFFYNFNITKQDANDLLIYSVKKRLDSNISIDLIEFLLSYSNNIFMKDNYLFKTAMYSNDHELIFILLKKINYKKILKNKGLKSLLQKLPIEIKYKLLIQNI